MNWRGYFKKGTPSAIGQTESGLGVTEEERYQAFKSRMMEELGIGAEWKRGGSQKFGFEECANDDRAGFEED